MGNEVLQECQDGFISLKIGLASAVKDIEINAKVIDKLAEAVEKIEIMNQNLCKMIALHEHKHDATEKVHETIDEDFKDLTARIDVLMSRQREPEPTSASFEHNTDATAHNAELKKVLEQFNRWKYMFMGGLVVVGYLLSHLEHFGAFILALLK